MEGIYLLSIMHNALLTDLIELHTELKCHISSAEFILGELYNVRNANVHHNISHIGPMFDYIR